MASSFMESHTHLAAAAAANPGESREHQLILFSSDNGGSNETGSSCSFVLDPGENWLEWSTTTGRKVQLIHGSSSGDPCGQRRWGRGVPLQRSPELQDPIAEEYSSFLCFDVEGPTVTVKDMREEDGNSDSSNILDTVDDYWVVVIENPLTHERFPLERRRMHVMRTDEILKLHSSKNESYNSTTINEPTVITFSYRHFQHAIQDLTLLLQSCSPPATQLEDPIIPEKREIVLCEIHNQDNPKSSASAASNNDAREKATMLFNSTNNATSSFLPMSTTAAAAALATPPAVVVVAEHPSSQQQSVDPLSQLSTGIETHDQQQLPVDDNKKNEENDTDDGDDKIDSDTASESEFQELPTAVLPKKLVMLSTLGDGFFTQPTTSHYTSTTVAASNSNNNRHSGNPLAVARDPHETINIPNTKPIPECDPTRSRHTVQPNTPGVNGIHLPCSPDLLAPSPNPFENHPGTPLISEKIPQPSQPLPVPVELFPNTSVVLSLVHDDVEHPPVDDVKKPESKRSIADGSAPIVCPLNKKNDGTPRMDNHPSIEYPDNVTSGEGEDPLASDGRLNEKNEPLLLRDQTIGCRDVPQTRSPDDTNGVMFREATSNNNFPESSIVDNTDHGKYIKDTPIRKQCIALCDVQLRNINELSTAVSKNVSDHVDEISIYSTPIGVTSQTSPERNQDLTLLNNGGIETTIVPAALDDKILLQQTTSTRLPQASTTQASRPSKNVNLALVHSSPMRKTRSAVKKVRDRTEAEPTRSLTGSKRPRRNSRLEFKTKVSCFANIRILATGVDVDIELKQLAESMGVVWIDSHAEAHTATHVIVSDGGTSPVRRTVKLMIALCRTSKLVRLDWLVQSAAQKMVLPCDSFLVVLPTLNLTSKPTGSSNRSVHRNKSNTSPRDEVGKDAYLLTGWSVLLCNGVASTKKTPPLEDYQWIVQAAGAQWMTAASFLEPTAQPAQQKLLVVTSDPERKSQCAKLPAPVLAALNAEEAKKRTTTWLFVALMSQNVDDLSPI